MLCFLVVIIVDKMAQGRQLQFVAHEFASTKRKLVLLSNKHGQYFDLAFQGIYEKTCFKAQYNNSKFEMPFYKT